MSKKAVFKGLVFSQNDELVTDTCVGTEAFYVLNDDGFLRHIPAEQVDRQVLQLIQKQVEENKDLIAQQTEKMIGQQDLFTHALIQNQLEHVDEQFDSLMQSGLPENVLAYMGMSGFKIIVDHHGEVVEVNQPSATEPGNEE